MFQAFKVPTKIANFRQFHPKELAEIINVGSKNETY